MPLPACGAALVWAWLVASALCVPVLDPYDGDASSEKPVVSRVASDDVPAQSVRPWVDPRPIPPPALRAVANRDARARGRAVDFIATNRPYALATSVDRKPDRRDPYATHLLVYAYRESCACWVALGEVRDDRRASLEAFGMSRRIAARLQGVERASRAWVGRFAFFPPRPRGIALRHARGVIYDYGVGNLSGGFRFRDGRGRMRDFYVGARVGSRDPRAACVFGGRIDATTCPSWPGGLVPGRTVVDVTWWRQERDPYDDTLVDVSDEIDPIPVRR